MHTPLQSCVLRPKLDCLERLIALVHPPHRERKEYCLFVASKKSKSTMKLPEEKYMENLKKALSTEEPSQWYKPEASSQETRALDIRAPSSRFTYAPLSPRTGKYMRLIIYGYMLPEEFLDAYAIEHNMSPVVTERDKLNAHTSAILRIKTKAGLFWRGTIAIIHPPHRERNEYRLFVASNESELVMRLPEEKYMEKLKKALGMEDPPQWYRQSGQQPAATTQTIVAELKLAAQALGPKLSENSEQDVPNIIHTAYLPSQNYLQPTFPRFPRSQRRGIDSEGWWLSNSHVKQRTRVSPVARNIRSRVDITRTFGTGESTTNPSMSMDKQELRAAPRFWRTLFDSRINEDHMEAKREGRSAKPFSEFRKEHQHSHINSETFESKASIKNLTKGIFAVGRERGFAIREGIA
ncbi:hypothetical protein HETIRDRAFT_119469 [Heterobasidion irregulare TC 32-1]|uniref:Uncharacterized protein n=1 Tax=Heterobasidion irregulare (strain TC 32-1) TaxID=747525 RepID=W4KC51_HETIT|nr:uncharacterized protein HETIRDRAFT_119469 [Heterobasidion irregulare TC 32-1]ETW83343.1 hypothetical protein HETIRDRAFT_119469 [Heterobasidion irregulare TC 32-1]